MPASQPFDSRLLGNTGYALEDGAYAQAVAELGVEPLAIDLALMMPAPSLVWRPGTFISRRMALGIEPPIGSLEVVRTAWQQRFQIDHPTRIILHTEDFEDVLDVAEVWRILHHPAVRVLSIFAGRKMPEADLRRQWPLRIAALPDTFDALRLKRLAKLWPSRTLTRVQPLTRSESRCEILVMLGSARETLRRVLELPHRVRAGHVVLIGPMDFAWRDIRNHVDTLLAETQAAAISFVSWANKGVAEQINSWVSEFSHNQPYDRAIHIPGARSLHVLNFRLFPRAAMPTVAMDLGRRLKELPPECKLRLPVSLLN